MRKTLNIVESEIYKQGVNNGKAWTLRNVKDEQGNRYSTFMNVEVGSFDCEVVTEKSTKLNPKTNKPYENLKITRVYGMVNMYEKFDEPVPVRHTGNLGAAITPGTTKQGSIPENQLNRIEDKIDSILSRMDFNDTP